MCDWNNFLITVDLNGERIIARSLPNDLGDALNALQDNRDWAFGSNSFGFDDGWQFSSLKVWVDDVLHKEISVAAQGSIAGISADP